LKRIRGGQKLRPFIVDVVYVDDEHGSPGERRRTAAVDGANSHPVARHHFAVEHGARSDGSRVWIDFEHRVTATVVFNAVNNPAVCARVGVGGIQLGDERADKVVFEDVGDVDGLIKERTDVIDIDDVNGQLPDTD